MPAAASGKAHPPVVPPFLPPPTSAGYVSAEAQPCLATDLDTGGGGSKDKDPNHCTGKASRLLASQGPAEPLQLSDCLLGWELWPAAWRLATYLVSSPGAELLRHAEAVLELGAGLGLPGIVAAKVGARSVTLTDLPQALPLLVANVKLNAAADVCRTAVLDWAQLASISGGRTDFTAAATAAAVVSEGGLGEHTAGMSQRPRWEEAVASEGGVPGVSACECAVACSSSIRSNNGGGEHTGAYDVVLAADVVYISSLAPLLADTVAAVCRGGGAVVLVGHTIRKSVWLDRTTGELRTDATDEPWETFMLRMTQVHGFSAARVPDEAAALGGSALSGTPSDTFVCAFTRPSPRIAA